MSEIQPSQIDATAARTEEEIRTQVRQLIMELAPNPQGQSADNARLVDNLGFHSLALMELAFALEDEFDLSPIDEQTARRIVSVEDVIEHAIDRKSVV